MRHAKLAIPLVILIAIAGIAFYLVNENSDDLGGITTINSTDTLKDSRTVINDNFNYLEANKLDNADFTGSTGITYTATGTISFDCSEVEGTGIDCSGESITLDATGDWTGTVTGHTGTYNHDNYNTAYSWGNHAGLYLTSGYSALATSTFQPIGSYLTGDYTAVATSTFQPLGSYLTGYYTAIATSTFQPIGSYMTAGYSPLATSTFVARADWTTIDSYPAACGAGDYVTAIGDTLTCGTPAGSGTVNSSATGTVAYYPGTAASVYGTTTLFIKEDGNVGIGTTTPATKLSVVGTVRVNLPDNTAQAFGIGEGVAPYICIDTTNDAEAIKFGCVAGSEYMKIQANGYVGIGTGTPYKLLSVNGDGVFVGNIGTQGTGTSTIAGDLDIADGLEAAIGWFTSALYSVNATLSGLLTTVNATITGVLDIPSGAEPLTDAEGEIAIDTTDDELSYFGTATRTLTYKKDPSLTIASTTWNTVGGAGTTTIPIGVEWKASTWTDIFCFTDTGTSSAVFGDGTNDMDYIRADAWVNGEDDGTIANNTFTAKEKRYIKTKIISGTPNFLSCTIVKSHNGE